jgi:CheY-like chemotaxis protein
VGAAETKPVMAARALLEGHVRQGSWFAIAVDVENAGPTVTGELRVAGGPDSKTRFGTPVELATGSRKTYLLYAQPPSFGGNMKVQLVSGATVISEATVATAIHDAYQTVVGVVSENPARIVSELKLPDMAGLDLLSRITERWPGLPVVVLAADACNLPPVGTIGTKDCIIQRKYGS